jgi:hypothetical protein
MRYKYSIIIFFIISSLACSSSKVFSQDSLDVSVTNRDYNNKILNLKFTIKANTKSYKLPDSTQIKIGYADDSLSDVFFQVRQILGSSDSILIPTADYTFKNHRNPPSILIYKNNSYTYNFNIQNYYTMLAGQHYQIRVCYKLTKYRGINNVYSNWIDVLY